MTVLYRFEISHYLAIIGNTAVNIQDNMSCFSFTKLFPQEKIWYSRKIQALEPDRFRFKF